MSTINAKANNAYNELAAEYEREHPDEVWTGFNSEKDAFEAGFEAALREQDAAS